MRVYPVDGVKAACCCVTVREQSAMGTLAIIASADVKIEGFVLFIKSWNAFPVEGGRSVWQVHVMVFWDWATHQTLGPPGARIANCAIAEPTSVVMTAKEAS
jgi:hypothetical protein